MNINNLSFKTKSSLIIIVLSLLILVGIYHFDNRVNGRFLWSKVQIDESTYNSIQTYYELSETALLSDIYFNDEQLIYDSTTNTFYYSKTDDAEGTSPTITLENGDNGLRNVLLGQDMKVAIYLDDSLHLILFQGTKASISDLVITTLPILNITISNETIAELGLDETYSITDYAGCSLYLYDNSDDFDQSSRTTVSSAKIHMRGGTTIGFPQKSYRISLTSKEDNLDSKSKASLLGLREDDDWILYSPYSDYEKIRNVFSMNMWHEMASGNNEWNAAVSNESKYVEVFFNNRYHGLYALTYPVDSKQFSLTDDETLFKKKDWSGTEFSLDLEYTEYDDGSIVYYLPGYSVEDGAGDYSTLHELYYTLAYSDDVSQIRSACDIDNSIDLWLFYKLSQAVDNVYSTNVKNLYVATKESDDGLDGYKLLFSPWDMDQTFGNRYVDGQGSHGITSYYNTPDYDLPMEWSPVYFLMANGDSEIVKQVQERYTELRSTIWSDEYIRSAIAGYEADIYDSGAFGRTLERWPDGNYYNQSVKLDDFETYVLERFSYMDDYIANLSN